MIDPTKYGAKKIDPAKYGAKLVTSGSSTEFPTGESPEIKQSFLRRLGGAAQSVGDFIGSTKLGQGLSTVNFNPRTGEVGDQSTGIAKEQLDQSAQNAQNVSKLLEIYHSSKDPVQKQHLADILKTFGTDVTATDVNSGFGLSNKEVLGSAAQTALTIVSAGSLPGEGAASGVLSKGVNLSDKLATTNLLAKTGKYAPTIARTLEGGALGYGYDKAQQATDNKQMTAKPGFGTATGIALPVVIKGLGYLTKNTLGATTGAGNQIIDRAVKNPNEVNNAIRTYSKDEASKIGLVERAKNAIYTYLKDRSTQYGDTLAQLDANTVKMKNGSVYLRRLPTEAEKAIPGYKGGKALYPNTFTTKGLKDTLTKTLKDFGAKGSGKTFDFSEVALPSSDVRKLTDLTDRIYNWSNNTPTGLNKLRQIVASYDTGGKNLPFDKIIGDLRTNISKYTDKTVPLVGEMNATFGKQTQLAKDLLSELNLKTGNSKPSTQLNSIMRLFKKDPQVIKNLTQVMGEEGVNSLLNDLSGAILSDALPSGLTRQIIEGNLSLAGLYGLITGGISLPAFAAGISTASPRIVGEGATLAGKLIQKGVGTGSKRIITKEASQLSK